MALSQYDKSILSPEDQERIELEKKAYASAKSSGDTEGMNSANERAEAIRRAYGYSGGEGGSNYVPLEGYEGAETLKNASAGMDEAYNGINEAYKAQAEASKEQIDKERDAALKQAYLGNMADQKNIDQQMRASGITGGLSEMSRVALQQNYRTNRNNTQNAAITAKKDVDVQTQQNIAQNELGRASANYNAQVTESQFQNTAATNKRNIEQQKYSNAVTDRQLAMSERQLALTEDQAALSKYTSFIQSGLVDESNSAKIAQSLGVSENAVLTASRAAQNADYASMALNLLSAGIYDDSFVDLLGNRFSAETLKTYAAQSKEAINTDLAATRASTAANDGDKNDIEEDEPVDIAIAAKNVDYGEGLKYYEWADLADTYGMEIEDIKKYFNIRKYVDNNGGDEATVYRMLYPSGDENKTLEDYKQDAKKLLNGE